MMMCLVTDRRRLAAAVGVPADGEAAVLIEQVVAAAEAGIDYIQLREPDLEARALADLAGELLRRTRHTAAKLLVNDRLDVALAAGAHGVHLKEEGIGPAIVRRLVPTGFIISCSVHTTAVAAARKAADFLIAGTVRSTASKRPPEYLNEEGLRRIVRAAAGQPVLGIGGLDESSVPLLRSSGAAGLAAIGAFIPAGGESVSEFVQKRVRNVRFALDSMSRRP